MNVSELEGMPAPRDAGLAGPYRRLLAEPTLRRIALADASSRLPQGMMSLTLLLLVSQHSSMEVAGLALAGYTLGAAVTAPVRGRMADRRGLFNVCAACAGGYILALLGLLAASLARAPGPVLIAASCGAGLLMPPLSPGVRGLWSTFAGAGLRNAAFALDAAVFDLSFIVGPVLASVLSYGVAPAAALFVTLALTSVAVAALVPHARSGIPRSEGARGEGSDRHLLGALRSAGLRRLLAIAALANVALSATEVALTAYARDHHALWASGPLLAGLSAGSITGSLLLGARAPQRAARSRLARLLACYAAALAGLAVAALYAPLLGLAVPLAGLCLGPVLATLFSAAGSSAPEGSGTETQAWINSIMNGGAAGGSALAGLTASRPILGMALAATAAAGAAAAAMRAARAQ